MLLTLDIGNTTITAGVYTGAEPGARWRVATARERTADEYGVQLVGFLQHAARPHGGADGRCRV